MQAATAADLLHHLIGEKERCHRTTELLFLAAATTGKKRATRRGRIGRLFLRRNANASITSVPNRKSVADSTCRWVELRLRQFA
ncbi:hypothetical protein KSP39_PZI024148 [Platanthera zijinensis]|uniref:Uncharacterized protein n=1 Tax=Platanthera zijinensis TaxID=2320716 RepID=A0AAP0FU94_9ASPA